MGQKKGVAAAGEQRFRNLCTKAGWSCRVQSHPKYFQGMALGRIFVYLEPGNTFGRVWTIEHVGTWDTALRKLIKEIEQRPDIQAKFTPADLHLD